MSRIAFVLCAYLVIVLADPDRPGKFLNHDRTVINCARYKREANQHQCVLSPFTTEGPFFLPDDLQRSDITDGQSGIQLNLTIILVNSNDCSPLENMFVHVWHANAVGKYSGVGEMGPGPGLNGPNGPKGSNSSEKHGSSDGRHRPGPEGDDRPNVLARHEPINDERFLRGYQVTNKNGSVNFNTIIPGWYAGRALHIHLEVYSRNTTESSEVSYVGQMFFKEGLPESLKLNDPYSANTNPITMNENDDIYKNGHGDLTTTQLETVNSLSYKSTIIFGVDPEAHAKSQV